MNKRQLPYNFSVLMTKNLVFYSDQSYIGTLFYFSDPQPILLSQLLGMKVEHSLLKIPAYVRIAGAKNVLACCFRFFRESLVSWNIFNMNLFFLWQ